MRSALFKRKAARVPQGGRVTVQLVTVPKDEKVLLALQLRQAADAISVSESYLKKLIKEGYLKAKKIRFAGQKHAVTLVAIAELERFINTGSSNEQRLV